MEEDVLQKDEENIQSVSESITSSSHSLLTDTVGECVVTSSFGDSSTSPAPGLCNVEVSGAAEDKKSNLPTDPVSVPERKTDGVTLTSLSERKTGEASTYIAPNSTERETNETSTPQTEPSVADERKQRSCLDSLSSRSSCDAEMVPENIGQEDSDFGHLGVSSQSAESEIKELGTGNRPDCDEIDAERLDDAILIPDSHKVVQDPSISSGTTSVLNTPLTSFHSIHSVETAIESNKNSNNICKPSDACHNKCSLSASRDDNKTVCQSKKSNMSDVCSKNMNVSYHSVPSKSLNSEISSDIFAASSKLQPLGSCKSGPLTSGTEVEFRETTADVKLHIHLSSTMDANDSKLCVEQSVSSISPTSKSDMDHDVSDEEVRAGVDIQPAPSLFPQTVSQNEAVLMSSRSKAAAADTAKSSEMCFKFRCKEETSNQLKQFLLMSEEKRMSSAHRYFIGHHMNESSIPSANPPCSLGQRCASGAESHSKSTADYSLSPVTHSFPAPKCSLISENHPAVKRVSKQSSSGSSSKVKNTPPNTGKKSCPKGSKQKLREPPIMGDDDNDDDDDDITDFIPVGMVQVPLGKRQESCVSKNLDAEILTSTGTALHQPKLKDDFPFEQLVSLEDDQSLVEGSRFMQERLKNMEDQFHQEQYSVQQQKIDHLPDTSQIKPSIVGCEQNSANIHSHNVGVQLQDIKELQLQHQYLIQLEQAEQQQQHVQQLQNCLHLTCGSLSKPLSFLKSQDFIKHGQKPDSVQISSPVQNSCLQMVDRSHSKEAENIRYHLQQDTPDLVSSEYRVETGCIILGNDGGFGQSLVNKPQTVGQSLSQGNVSAESNKKLLLKSASTEPHKKLIDSDIPISVEQSHQQHVTEEQIVQQSELLSGHLKTNQSLTQKASTLRSGLEESVPVSFASEPLSHSQSCVNQQHSEKGTSSSQVSQRYPSSPRHPVSLEEPTNLTPSKLSNSSTSSQHLVISNPQKSSSPGQLTDFKSVFGPQFAECHPAASIKATATSSGLEHLVNRIQLESYEVQIKAVHHCADQSQSEPSRGVLTHGAPASSKNSEFSSSWQQQHQTLNKDQLVNSDGQHIEPLNSTSVTNKASLNLSQPNQPYRQQKVMSGNSLEQSNASSEISQIQKSQTSSFHFPATAESSALEYMPSVSNITTSSQQILNQNCQPQLNSKENGAHSLKPVDLHFSEPADPQALSRQIQEQPGDELPGVSLLVASRVKEPQDHASDDTDMNMYMGNPSDIHQHDVKESDPSSAIVVEQVKILDTTESSISHTSSRTFDQQGEQTQDDSEKEVKGLILSSPLVAPVESEKERVEQEPEVVLDGFSEITDICGKVSTGAESLSCEARQNGGNVLSEYASERCVLEDNSEAEIGEVQTDQGTSLGTVGAGAKEEQSREPEAGRRASKPLSNIEKYNIARKKVASPAAKSVAVKELDDNLAQKGDKDLSVSCSETPQREVSQQKPKKAYKEQDSALKLSSRILILDQKKPTKTTRNRRKVFQVQLSSHRKREGQRSSQVKNMEEKEVAEHDEVKRKSIKQTRISPENLDNGHKEVGDGFRNADLGSMGYHLSKRLRMKKERQNEKNSAENNNMSKRLIQHTQNNYKDSSKHKSISTKNAQSSKQIHNVKLIPRRIITRSRDAGGKSSSSGDKKSNRTSEKKTCTTEKLLAPSQKERKISRIGSPVTATEKLRNTPFAIHRKMTTRQTLAAVEKSKSSKDVSMKRPIQPEFVDELPPWRKRVKGTYAPKVGQTSSRQSLDRDKDVTARTLTHQVLETAEESSRPKTETSLSEHSKVNKQSGRKDACSIHTLGQSKEEKLESQQTDCDRICDSTFSSDMLEDNKSQINETTSFYGKSDDKALGKAETVLMDTDDVEKSQIGMELNDEHHLGSVRRKSLQEEEMNTENSESEGGQTDVDHGKVFSDSKPQQVSDKAAEKPPPKYLTTSSESEAKINTVQSNAASTEKDLGQSFDLMVHTSKNQNMVMFRLVPILDEDLPDLKVSESLFPINGFFIPGGNNDRILLPRNFMQRLSTARMPSAPPEGTESSVLSAGYSSVSASLTSTQQMSSVSPLHQVPGDAPAHVTGSKPMIVPDMLSVCSSAGSMNRSSDDPLSTWTSSTQLSSLSTVWTSDLPHSPSTPPSSAGEHTKRMWTPTVPQASPSQHSFSPPWNATPPSVPPSSSSSSSSAWNLSSSVSQPLSVSHQPQQQQEHLWTLPAQQIVQESSWRTSSLAAAESWAKDFFPNTECSGTDLRQVEPVEARQVQVTCASSLNEPLNSGYSAEADSPLRHQMYISNDGQHSIGAARSDYNSCVMPVSESADARQDSLIQGFLRQMSSSTEGFNQELAGFGLGNQDFAYIENRLRQALSPTMLFSAETGYDGAGEQGLRTGHEQSFSENINLVHTVNLDMDERNLGSSASLNLPELGSSNLSASYLSRNFGEQDTGVNEGHTPLESMYNSGNLTNYKSTDNTEKPQRDIKKKTPRERKSQYEVITENNVRRLKCLLCGKIFSIATIYRHLRSHDPDYRVRCHLCGKLYTQRHSLELHRQKSHPEHAALGGSRKSLKPEQLPSSVENKTSLEQEGPRLEQDRSSLQQERSASESERSNLQERSNLRQSEPSLQEERPSLDQQRPSLLEQQRLSSEQEGSGLDPGGPVLSREPESRYEPNLPDLVPLETPTETWQQEAASLASNHLSESCLESDLLKQQAAYRQVEELRRIKAEKKLAAAKRKTQSQSGDSREVGEGDLFKGRIRTVAGSEVGNQLVDCTFDSKDFTGEHIRQLSNTMSIDSTDSQQAMSIGMTPAGPAIKSSYIVEGSESACETSSFTDEPRQQTDAESHDESVKGGGMHVCEICGIQLCSRNGYMLHVRRHSQIKTKFCSYCQKSFHTTQELRSHERVHTGEKPYKCEICYAAFAHSGSYVAHKKGHDKRGEIEPFPIIDNEVQYPPKYKKPRSSRGEGESDGTRKRIKKQKKSVSVFSETGNFDQVNVDGQPDMEQNTLDNNSSKFQTASMEDFNMRTHVNRLSLDEENQNTSNFRSDFATLPPIGQDLNSNCLKADALQHAVPQEEAYGKYIGSGNNSSAVDNCVLDYYGSQTDFSQNLQQQQLFRTQQTEALSQDHNFYKYDKYFSEPSDVNTDHSTSPSIAASASINMAMVKSRPYEDDSQNGKIQVADSYYSSHQMLQEYQYSVPPESIETSHEQSGYEASHDHYQRDPSSSEIVKKLLQHYNVSAPNYQDSEPIGYDHHMGTTPRYPHTGPDPSLTSGYISAGLLGNASAFDSSPISQEKHCYNSQNIMADCGPVQQQVSAMQNQPAASSGHYWQPQHDVSLLMQQDEQFGSTNP